MILGFWETILATIISVGNIFLGLLVFLKDSRSAKHRYFFYLSLALAFWIVSAYVSEFFPLKYPFLSLIFSKLAISGALLSVSFFFVFSLFSFSKLLTLTIQKISKVVLSISFLLVVLNFSTPFLVNNISVYPDGRFDIVYGSLYYFFFLPYIVLLLGFSLFKSLSGYKYLSKSEKEQCQYFLLGIGIFALFNVIFNILVPLYIRSDIYYRVGNYSSIFLLGFTAYAILAKRLFNIKIILTEIIVGFIAILLLINLLLSQTLPEYIWKGILFLLFLLSGHLLIKSVYREISYRTKLEKAYRELQKLDKAKSEFLSIASHQLRTPLSIMKGYLSMIMEGSYGKVAPKIKEITKSLFQTNEQLIKLVNNLLNISRIEAGKIEMNLESVEIGKLIKEIIKEIEPEAKEKGLTLIYEEKEVLPMVTLDLDKIKQVLLNILDNAIKYTPKGSIRVIGKTHNGNVLIKISDTGVGMTKEELQNIFASFKRGEAGEKLWTGGSGLGLYVAKKFVEMHNGKIWAESEGKGKGSTFYIELPINQKI
jgi:signal transduction histidine kinase